MTFTETVYVTAGTLLTLSGQANGEVLRTDKFTFTRIDTPNEAPSAPLLDTATVDENAAGAVIGALSATDPDGDAALIVFSVDAASDFEVVGGQLKLKDGVPLDHEESATVDVVVTATDAGGASTTATLTVTVANVDEAPFVPVLDSSTVDENADGAVIGTLSSADPEGTAVSFTLSDARFEINSEGVLKLKADETLNHEAADTVSLDVTAEDATGQSITETLVITVNDLEEAPTLATPAALDDVALDNGVGGTIDLSVLGAADEDEGAVVAYAAASLPEGFEIVANELIVPSDAPEGAYQIEVFATDGALDSDSVFFTVTVGAPAPFEPIVIQAEIEEGTITLAQPADGNSTQIRDDQNQETNGNRPDFSGTGYVDYGNDAGDTLSIPVNITVAGQYDLNIRYASNTDRPLDLVINGGAAQSLPFVSTDPDGPGTSGPEEGFDHWEFLTVTVDLVAGANTIALSIPSGTNTGPNIDRIEITEAGSGPIPPADLSADEDGNLAAAPENATVAVEDLATVEIRLTGVDADIIGYEVSVDGAPSPRQPRSPTAPTRC